MIHYCTYFDKNYLPRGLIVINSLIKTGQDFKIFVLALDDEVVLFFAQHIINQVICIPISQIEAFDNELKAAKANRSIVEYYFTLSPCLPLYLLHTFPEIDFLAYLDSDLYFFKSPTILFDELGSKSVFIIPHRFEPAKIHLEIYGKYNVGFQIYRKSITTIAILTRWRAQCLAWCYDVLEEGKFADQKYLDEWPSLFGNEIVVSNNPGANLAPWNLNNHKLTYNENEFFVDDQPLIFYHFQRLRFIKHRIATHGLDEYGVTINSIIQNKLYAPYLTLLREETKIIANKNEAPIRLSKKYTFKEFKRLLRSGKVFISVSRNFCWRPFLKKYLNL